MVCGRVREAEQASVTEGTVALESLSEFLAMKLMAGSLPHTQTVSS
jgi:hypothetical protein